MAHRRLIVDRVLVSAWRTPEREDVAAITTELADLAGRVGRAPLYLSVIGASSLPKGGIRDELIGFYQSLLARCESIHVVIEGRELAEIRRSVIANVLLVVPAGGRVFLDSSLQGVIAASPAGVRVELARAAQIASEQRLFDFARADPAPAS